MQLVLTDWKFTWTKGYPRTLIVFLFDLSKNSCEVFVSAGTGQPANSEKVLKAIQFAFENTVSERSVEWSNY